MQPFLYGSGASICPEEIGRRRIHLHGKTVRPAKLDTAAANFHSTSADFEFDSIQTDPVPDKEVQKGTVYYERHGKYFQMAAHIEQENGKPVPKIYTFSKESSASTRNFVTR